MRKILAISEEPSNVPVLKSTVQEPVVSDAPPVLVKNVSITPSLVKSPVSLSSSVIPKVFNPVVESSPVVVTPVVTPVEVPAPPKKETILSPSVVTLGAPVESFSSTFPSVGLTKEESTNNEQDMSVFKKIFNGVKNVVGTVLPVATSVVGTVMPGVVGQKIAEIGTKLGGVLKNSTPAQQSVGVVGQANNTVASLSPVIQSSPSVLPSNALGVLGTNASTLDLASVMAVNAPNMSTGQGKLQTTVPATGIFSNPLAWLIGAVLAAKLLKLF